MEYNGMKEDERLISVTPSKRQISYQNRSEERRVGKEC